MTSPSVHPGECRDPDAMSGFRMLERRADRQHSRLMIWIPAFAGMHGEE
jgi:hypothetical protein